MKLQVIKISNCFSKEQKRPFILNCMYKLYIYTFYKYVCNIFFYISAVKSYIPYRLQNLKKKIHARHQNQKSLMKNNNTFLQFYEKQNHKKLHVFDFE